MSNTTSISANPAGYLFALGSAVLFAIRPIFVKLVYEEGTDPLTLIGFRMLFSLPIYVIILIWLLRDPELRARLNTKNVLQTSFVGWLGYYIASYLDLIGLQYVTAQLGRMVLYVYPTFVVLFGALLFKHRFSMQTLLSLLLTYTGVLLIFGYDLQTLGSDVIKGSFIILLCAACFAFYLLLSKPLIEEIGSRLFTAIALISASVGILGHYGFTSDIANPNVTQTALFWCLVIAIFCTVIPTFLTTAAVGEIGASKTGIVATIGPGFTSVFAVSILSEEFTVYHLLGIIITIAGVWFLSREKVD